MPRPCAKGALKSAQVPVPVVDLPLGATEDRVVGALDLERALARGEKAFEPGLLARAHRGFLYIDEANLLEDHLVDLLLDVAASGENVVEREGLSIRHPARFVLVGTGNPEEGELRPQLLDRFGMSVEVKTPDDFPSRIEVVRRRDEFESDTAAFTATWAKEETKLRKKITSARERLPSVTRVGRGAGTRGEALHGARHRWPARRTDADARGARAGGARRQKDRRRRSFAPGRAVRVAPSAAPQSARRCRLQRAGRSRHRGNIRMTAALAWSDAVTAAQLFAVDPVGTGGVLLRSRAGPVRERWLTMLRAALPPSGPLKYLPLHIADGRLLGGLDLNATLLAGRPVAERGLLAEADGGVLVLAMAERLPSATSVHITAAMDARETIVERDGLSLRMPARFGVIALDEGLDDEFAPASLRDRLAFHVDLNELSIRDAEEFAMDSGGDFGGTGASEDAQGQQRASRGDVLRGSRAWHRLVARPATGATRRLRQCRAFRRVTPSSRTTSRSPRVWCWRHARWCFRRRRDRNNRSSRRSSHRRISPTKTMPTTTIPTSIAPWKK